MKHLAALNKYFWKYRFRLLAGLVFVVLSNYFSVLAPLITKYVVNKLMLLLSPGTTHAFHESVQDPLARVLINRIDRWNFSNVVALCGVTLLVLALLRGLFMFFMRQTIIVMSRHIEFDQKNEVYQHYQRLDTTFYRSHSTGDLMNRITEDVSRVRMFTGPAIMYLVNLLALIGLSVYYMLKDNVALTLYTLAPLPLLAVTIYFVNQLIHKKSERIQALLSDLTTNAQQSYSGIRVIKSFVQEKAMLAFFRNSSEEYKTNALGLAKVEAIYFPAMSFVVGISTLLTILIGGFMYIRDPQSMTFGTLTEFVLFINMLMFPVSAIGSVASMTQRAAASQKRLNEFLRLQPEIRDKPKATPKVIAGDLHFDHVSFTYSHTGIKALTDFDLHIRKGQKVAIIGRTGSGKTTVAQLLLRMFDPDQGAVKVDGTDIRDITLKSLREQISYVPQDVFLFSDTVRGNILFGNPVATMDQVRQAAKQAVVDGEIAGFAEGYDTMIGERGVTLSGGQKQRVSIARALIKDPRVIVMDDCLSAVDARTEREIIGQLYEYLQDKTAIIITHRIFSLFQFDQVVVLDDGHIIERGTHDSLLEAGGYYADLYARQRERDERPSEEEVTQEK
ncbi:ABC transporter ATP-binding protein [Dinghuibacter silviterrae]|uniref:ATP-binding cassette subfamily B protein n=1 Tax=Dinghuibacter silviterrae TaxID=1539049 RepID=A0A4R8DWQ2_9BACT|nr:ABC transporter ATP-binding protein [Dinghuibacter silviterrae]TDX01641.1 ATP-binding cassette subfamily B protein [Dinghuibacter silviterrae]